ncbi:hypothetical protein B0H14DRAFT_2567311 [Mycena olivaceomarginata]|nr:hypothetical protein B0H14DRAFT_2567311 [Mycena olivaceomarginata]
MAAAPVQFLLSRSLHGTRRFQYENDRGVVHVWLALGNGESFTAQQLLALLPADSVIGVRLASLCNPPPRPPTNIYTAAGWPAYQEVLHQWVVAQREFKSWDDVRLFQEKNGWLVLLDSSVKIAETGGSHRKNAWHDDELVDDHPAVDHGTCERWSGSSVIRLW